MRQPVGPFLSWFLCSTFALGLAPGCKHKRVHEPVEEAEESASSPQSTDFVVAFLYGGARDEDGFNEAHRAGEAAVGRMMNVKVIHEDNVPEGSGAANYLEKVVTLRGASMVFATGANQFDPPVLEAAKKHPKLPFFHAGGLYQEGKHPANVGSYLGYLDEAFYVCGVVAGMTTRSNKLGFIAGLGNAASLRNVDAFTLGARSVNPRVTTAVLFTNSWSDAKAEEKAANALADKKVDVLASFVRSPRAILMTAEKRGIYSIGVHSDGAALAPKGHLTAAVSSWEKIYTDYVTAVRDGKAFSHVVRGGFGDGFVNIAPFGPAVSEQTKAKALEVRSKLMQGKLTIFKGPLRDNRGASVLRAGQEVVAKDVSLEMMGYLVEGVVGSIPD